MRTGVAMYTATLHVSRRESLIASGQVKGHLIWGCTYFSVKLEIMSLGIKGRFYANVFFRPKGKILRCPLCSQASVTI